MTILTPVIPRPRQGSAGRRVAAEALGRCGGLQHGNTATGRGGFQPIDEHCPDHEIADDAEDVALEESPTGNLSCEFHNLNC